MAVKKVKKIKVKKRIMKKLVGIGGSSFLNLAWPINNKKYNRPKKKKELKSKQLKCDSDLLSQIAGYSSIYGSTPSLWELSIHYSQGMILVDSDICYCNNRICNNLEPVSEDKLLNAIAKLGVVIGGHNNVLSRNQKSMKSNEGREANKILV